MADVSLAGLAFSSIIVGNCLLLFSNLHSSLWDFGSPASEVTLRWFLWIGILFRLRRRARVGLEALVRQSGGQRNWVQVPVHSSPKFHMISGSEGSGFFRGGHHVKKH